VKKIRSDNGSEFKNLQVEEYLEEEGIKHEFSTPYAPQQNGIVERRTGRSSTWRGQSGRIQDTRAVLVGSHEYAMPCHKPPLSSSRSQEYGIRAPN
jgi:transposase InsO family protein